MKSKIIILMLSALGLKATSQTTTTAEPGKYSFGVYGGANFQNINGKDMAGAKLENGLVTKFHGGVSEHIPVAPDFYISVGLEYMGKGSKTNVSYNGVPETRTVSLNYIQMPVNLLYKPLVGTGHFMLGFGPYMGYAFGGKLKFEGAATNTTQKVTFAKKINMTNPMDLYYFRRLDAGANIFFGYELSNHINFVFNAQLGLVQINPTNDNYPNSKLSEMNTGFGLSAGYRF
jgi:hypothetical protein